MCLCLGLAYYLAQSATDSVLECEAVVSYVCCVFKGGSGEMNLQLPQAKIAQG